MSGKPKYGNNPNDYRYVKRLHWDNFKVTQDRRDTKLKEEVRRLRGRIRELEKFLEQGPHAVAWKMWQMGNNNE